MNADAASLLLALVAPSALEAQPARTYPLTDERLLQIGEPRSRLREAIQNTVFSDAEIISAFTRVGLTEACSIYNRLLAKVLASHEPLLRPVVVAALRRHVPAQVLAAPTGWDWNTLLPYRRRVVADLEANGAGILAEARATLTRDFLAAAASAPAVGAADTSGDFADWDLDRPMARQSACLILGVGSPDNFAQRKLPFDGLFRRTTR